MHNSKFFTLALAIFTDRATDKQELIDMCILRMQDTHIGFIGLQQL